ncbi:hypothetical protein SNOG_08817 [Parastagonospora nodorum SN15]|uniref:Uncharacterized protein n=1 Tax=Phaeosphaeria nodorum (strain SN15 / ATCC MYA-4574 / FGSC 10173) TaxID=321614 RepID=Q0UHE7_PHANO|nr:hypothetical protein SNOG_08817 [Parastagonospora nodorum SN15]EAT83985.1 hypothetical protein SNOG_08817 [Parastagonospora nodorum SN15]
MASFLTMYGLVKAAIFINVCALAITIIMMTLPQLVAWIEREDMKNYWKVSHPVAEHECGVVRDHDCLDKNYNRHQGQMITLWHYMQYPEDRAREDRSNVLRFQQAKAFSSSGMGHGSSPLKHEVRAEDM